MRPQRIRTMRVRPWRMRTRGMRPRGGRKLMTGRPERVRQLAAQAGFRVEATGDMRVLHYVRAVRPA